MTAVGVVCITKLWKGSGPHLGDSVVRRDLTSKSILPGLIDCHVHLRNDGVADPRAQAATDTDAVAVLRSARNARRTTAIRWRIPASCKTRAAF
jgi:imidazolonepropionase-like amidohydrolase